MKAIPDIARHRLFNQRIAGRKFDRPGDVVRWMGMVQAQDYPGALWAIGLRMQGATEARIEQALANRTIVRTWPARGTLHFVAAADVRWMLELLTPRVIARSAGRFRQLELDEATIARGRKSLVSALQGGRQLPRNAVFQVLESAHVSTAGQRGIHVLWRLAQEGVICFGAREGRQQTFVLFEEWVPGGKTLARDEALAELARRYFVSHGPATLQDFAWWSGLTISDAKAGIEMARPQIVQEVVDGRAYWLSHSTPAGGNVLPTAHLLPAFDEYLVGYKDRSAVLDQRYAKRANAGGGVLNPTIVIGDRVMGTWKRTLKRETVIVTPAWFTKPDEARERALTRAALRYGAFLKLPVLLAQA